MAESALQIFGNIAPVIGGVVLAATKSAGANTFNIDSFIDTINRHAGVQKPSLFQVQIAIPNILQDLYNLQDMQDISFLCLQGTLPGPTIDSYPVRRYGYGLIEKMPFNVVFNDVTLVFIGDGDSLIQNFFRSWQRAIFEFSSEGSIEIPPEEGPNLAVPGMSPYLLNYKAAPPFIGPHAPGAVPADVGYSTIVQISTFDVTGIVTDLAKMRYAYPINVSDQTYQWGENDSFLLIPVTFTYMDTSYSAETNFKSDAANIQIPANTQPDFFASVSNFVAASTAKLTALL